MGRTQAELFAWSERARANSEEARASAHSARASARALRERGSRTVSAIAVTPCGERDLAVAVAVAVADDLPLEEAAERALMLDLTAREIAERLGVPVEYVVRGARERAAYLGAPVEDTLRSWFRVLLA
jgi:hypothetical protein